MRLEVGLSAAHLHSAAIHCSVIFPALVFHLVPVLFFSSVSCWDPDTYLAEAKRTGCGRKMFFFPACRFRPPLEDECRVRESSVTVPDPL